MVENLYKNQIVFQKWEVISVIEALAQAENE